MYVIRRTRELVAIFLALLLISLGGCASKQPYALTQADRELREVKSDPFLLKNAPLQIAQAERTVERARNVWDESHDDSEVIEISRRALRQIDDARVIAGKNAVAETAEDARYSRDLLEKEREVAHYQRRALKGESEARRTIMKELRELKEAELERRMLISLSSDLLFDFDESELKPGAEREIGPLVDFLKSHPEHFVKIEGHTDNIGDQHYNDDLSRRRARAVESFLTHRGVADSRISSFGLGESYPVAANTTAAGRLQNRRVEIFIAPVSSEG